MMHFYMVRGAEDMDPSEVWKATLRMTCVGNDRIQSHDCRTRNMYCHVLETPSTVTFHSYISFQLAHSGRQ